MPWDGITTPTFFLVIFSTSLSGSDVSLTRWIGNSALFAKFYGIFQICIQVQFSTLDGNIAIATMERVLDLKIVLFTI